MLWPLTQPIYPLSLAKHLQFPPGQRMQQDPYTLVLPQKTASSIVFNTYLGVGDDIEVSELYENK